MIKKIISILYILVLVSMAVATILEKAQGTDYVHTHIYGSWWFILLWAVMTALGIFYIIKCKVRRVSTLALHLSFVVILAGALVTHITAKRGLIHLRVGQTVNSYMTNNGEQGMKEELLPFSVCLQRFETKMHDVLIVYKQISMQFDEHGNIIAIHAAPILRPDLNSGFICHDIFPSVSSYMIIDAPFQGF